MNRWAENHMVINTNKKNTVANEEDIKHEFEKSKEDVNKRWNQNYPFSIKLSDFEIIKTLGKGSYANVMLVRYLKEKSKPLYAMKVMPKRRLLQTNHVKYALMERKIAESIQNRFIVQHYFHFQNNANLFLVMEFAPGGDIFTLLKKHKYFGESMTAFYSGQIVLALEYLHTVGIIHRDLKPENVLIYENGYSKITDFGFAKRIDGGKTYTVCGTPQYYAPEIIRNQSYSYPVDWWTLGIFIYELSAGEPPFNASNLMKLFRQILEFNVVFPNHFTPETVQIIKKLANVDMRARLTNPDVIRKSDFFKSINWVKLYNQEINPPFIPQLRSPQDTRYFDSHKPPKIEELPENLFQEEFRDF